MANRLAVTCLVLLTLGSPANSAAEPLPSLDELYKEYCDLGLPSPPQGARLLCWQITGGVPGPGAAPPTYSFAFETKDRFAQTGIWRPIGPKYGPLILTGVFGPHPVAPDPDALARVLPVGDEALVLAVQCRARGWTHLAERLRSRIGEEAARSYKQQFAALAWRHWERQLAEPGMDRAAVGRRLRGLIDRHVELGTKENRDLLRSLDLTLLPRTSKPGSIEALVDDLVDYHWERWFEPGEPVLRLYRHGFDAVPVLLDHLNDQRLTRGLDPDKCLFGVLRVKGLVATILLELASGAVSDDWFTEDDRRVDEAAVRRWWAKAKKVGEEAYVLSHVVDTDRPNSSVVNDTLLTLVAAKYPRRLPALYRTVLDRSPGASSQSLARALLRADLPARDKLAAFLYGAGHADAGHRCAALKSIRELDADRFNDLLLAAINAWPTDVPEWYAEWTERPVAELVLECDDRRVWRALERAADRASVGFRMEIIYSLGSPGPVRRELKRMQFLSHFLADATLCDTSGNDKFKGPCGVESFGKISVRDFAALALAHRLGSGDIDILNAEDRTPEQWAALRARVRRALKDLQVDFDLPSRTKAARP